MRIKQLTYISCFFFSACSIQVHSQYVPKKPKTLYNYRDFAGDKHIFAEEVFKLKETSYLYCYEHKTLHELEVIPYKKAKDMGVLKARKGNPEG